MRRQIGRHLIEIEDDVLISRMNGDFRLDDIMEYYALCRELGRDRIIYSIGDMTRAGGIEPEARRYAVENGKGLNFGGTVSFGMNITMRTLLTMLTRATQLLGRTRDSGAQMSFVATEEEARSYISNRRKLSGGAPALR